ncbi:hypothetical protein LIER_32784 [Lithospermum erythrorhizon]|uniref:DUF4283 domain-containing protein n=1 Tax=Lithospermum erythrorhizon TaxID=34254 RepID=A0AAV3RUT0_LITER
MKKKKKRKHPPPDPDNEASHLVASNVDPSLLVEVPIDYRVNVEGVLDQQSQLEVEQWSRNDLSLPVETSNACSMGSSARVNLPQSNGVDPSSSNLNPAPCENVGACMNDGSKNHPVCPVSQPVVASDSGLGCVNAPKSGIHMNNAPHAVIPADVIDKTNVALEESNSGKVDIAMHPCIVPGTSSGGSKVTPPTGSCLVFKAGSSGDGCVTKDAGSNGSKTKAVGAKKQRAMKAVSRGPGANLAAASIPNRPNPPIIEPKRPEPHVPGAAQAGPHKAAQVRPTYSDVIKDNRIVGNGFTLEHYDLMEDEDDVVLDESDEVPFLETWGYCLIGCFTGPFPGRQALNSLVNSWNVKCRIIPYAKGWTVFRFKSDEDRFRVFNGGPYLAFGKTLMLRLVDAGVIIGDDLFTSVPTWVLFHDVQLSVWSETGLSKIASKVGIPMYTDKFTKERSKMSYARCLVDVDVSKPPVMEFGVKLPGGKRYTQKVTYECYPDYCCDCKKFGHNIFKCPKKVKPVETPVVLPTDVPTVDPVSTMNPVPTTNPVSGVNPKPVHYPKVFRTKTRVKTKSKAPNKVSSSKGNNIIEKSTLPMEKESGFLVISPQNKGPGSKKMDKGKAIASSIPMVSVNPFEALKNIGGISGTHNDDVTNDQMSVSIPSASNNAEQEGGMWQHVKRKGGSNGRGWAVSASVSPCV